jgi:hypothetical protein
MSSAAHRPLSSLENPGACRYCGQPSWLSDQTGPLHPCCQLWAEELKPAGPAPACAASRTARHRRH